MILYLDSFFNFANFSGVGLVIKLIEVALMLTLFVPKFWFCFYADRLVRLSAMDDWLVDTFGSYLSEEVISVIYMSLRFIFIYLIIIVFIMNKLAFMLS